MSQKNRTGGALAPWLVGLGLCGALWGAAGGSCAGPRSGPLSRTLHTPPPEPAQLEQVAGTAETPDHSPLPELDPQVASRLNLLQEAMNTSAVDLPGSANTTHTTAAATTEPEIDWSAPATPVQNTPEQQAIDLPPMVVMGQDAATSSPSTTLTTPIAQAAPMNPAQRVEQLTGELADATTDLALRDGSAVQALMRLAALEMVLPGVSDAAFAEGNMASAIAPDELALLRSWRDVLRSMGTRGPGASDAGALVEAADNLSLATQQWRDLTIQNTSLCTRVDGFGVYEPLPERDDRYTLVAGRTNRVIVYLELDHFHTIAARQDGMDGFSVELSQSLALYHAGTPRVETDRDLIAWQRPEVQIEDFSRRARRDFFIVQMIELPSTLSVGSYRLKVLVTDRASGAEAESVLDIDVVADASVARIR